MTFEFEGARLLADYDEEADILYLWTEPGARPAVTFEDAHGHLIQLDPETRQFLGVMIVDYRLRWEGDQPIHIQIPGVEERVLEPVG